MRNVTQILARVEQGDDEAAAELLPLVYDELRKLAAHKMSLQPAGQTLQATALVHEAYLRLVAGAEKRWESRQHFFNASAEAMRHILIDRARRRLRVRHGEDAEQVALDDVEITGPAKDEIILQLNDALEELKQRSPEQAQIVNYTLTASCSGECQLTGVVVTDQLPSGFGFVSASAQQGTWAFDVGCRQLTFFIGLMPKDRTVDLGISTVALLAGTFTNTAQIRFNSTNAPVVLDPGLVTIVQPNTNAVPPMLSLRFLSPLVLELSLSGQSGLTYEIDSSADLLSWSLLTNIVGPSWTQTLTGWPKINQTTQFYRARVSQ